MRRPRTRREKRWNAAYNRPISAKRHACQKTCSVRKMIYVAIALLMIGTLAAVGNMGGTISAIRRQRRGNKHGYSNVPFISLAFCAGAWALGRDTIGLWAFVPTALDPGTWMLVALPGALIDSFRNPPEKTEHPAPADR